MLRNAALLIATTALLGACGGDDDPTPADAAATVDASTTDGGSVCGGTTAYLGICAMDNDCMSCTCRSFGHSMICTQTCTVDTDCPAPSGGCSSGFCRP